MAKFCGKCGNTLDNTKKFCSKCGTPNPAFTVVNITPPVKATKPVTDELEKLRLEKDRIDRELAEKERIAREKVERERLEQLRLQEEKLKQEIEEKERLERKRIEWEKKKKELEEAERAELERKKREDERGKEESEKQQQNKFYTEQNSKSDKQDELLQKLIEERELFKREIQELKQAQLQKESSASLPEAQNQKEEGEKPKSKNNAWKYLLLVVLLAGFGVGGYFGYLNYFVEDSYQAAQRNIIKGDWAIAQTNLENALSDANSGKLKSTTSGTLGADELSKLQLWNTWMPSIVAASNTAKSIFPNAETVSLNDLIGLQSQFAMVPLVQLKQGKLGKVEPAAALLPFELKYDSAKLFLLKKLLEPNQQKPDFTTGQLIYNTAFLVINVDSMLTTLLHPSDAGISSVFALVKGMRNQTVSLLILPPAADKKPAKTPASSPAASPKANTNTGITDAQIISELASGNIFGDCAFRINSKNEISAFSKGAPVKRNDGTYKYHVKFNVSDGSVIDPADGDIFYNPSTKEITFEPAQFNCG